MASYTIAGERRKRDHKQNEKLKVFIYEMSKMGIFLKSLTARTATSAVSDVSPSNAAEIP